jgi:hypothetical protein
MSKRQLSILAIGYMFGNIPDISIQKKPVSPCCNVSSFDCRAFMNTLQYARQRPLRTNTKLGMGQPLRIISQQVRCHYSLTVKNYDADPEVIIVQEAKT